MLITQKTRVALRCVEKFIEICPNLQNDVIWIEPSVGGGSFVRALQKTIGQDVSVITIDTNPDTVAMYHTNFLHWETPNKGNIKCVGNPPFGKNSSIAIQFVNHSAKFASLIGFILPNSFNKPSIIKRIDRHLHIIYSQILDGECFTFDNKSVSVPCSFYVFEKRDVLRLDPEPLPTKSFLVSFLSDAEGATFMVQRVGQRAGRVFWDTKEMEQRGISKNFYFVKIKDVTEEQRHILKDISMEVAKERLNTSGMPSLSKGEVVKFIHDTLKIKI
ncbi:MAG: hypothetical protein K2Q45_05300 [Nitrosomonas sp.]|nr:hypothetical protein [Nitrosomonas sp.]